MKTLKRLTRPLLHDDIPVQALLYPDESLLASQIDVGVYDGNTKSDSRQFGDVYLSSHRLFWVDRSNNKNKKTSFSFDLQTVQRTDYYAGFLKSSPKIIVHFHPPAHTRSRTLSTPASSVNLPRVSNDDSDNDDDDDSWSSWECAICAYRNPPGLSPHARSVCGLCGMPRDVLSSTKSIPIKANKLNAEAASSLPSPSINTNTKEDSGIPCPACTFLNHPSLRECEICGTSLPRHPNTNTRTHTPSLSLPSNSKSKSLPASRAPTPFSSISSSPNVHTNISSDSDSDSNISSTPSHILKLSFHQGGDKPFYAAFRRAVGAKAWLGDEASSVPASLRIVKDAEDGPGRGIDSILSTLTTTQNTTTTALTAAFADLEALMRRAREMVGLARELGEKLRVLEDARLKDGDNDGGEGKERGEEQKFVIHNSLALLGLEDALSPSVSANGNGNDSSSDGEIKTEDKYTADLARELATLLVKHVESMQAQTAQSGSNSSARYGLNPNNANSSYSSNTPSPSSSYAPPNSVTVSTPRFIQTLDTIWCLWNRARGIALLPPATLLSVLPLVPKYTRLVSRERYRNRNRKAPNVHVYPRSGGWEDMDMEKEGEIEVGEVEVKSRTLRSGIVVLYTRPFEVEVFWMRVRGMLGIIAGGGGDGSTSSSSGSEDAGTVSILNPNSSIPSNSTAIDSTNATTTNSNTNPNTSTSTPSSSRTRTTSYISHLEQLSYALAEELLLECEARGWACRDGAEAYWAGYSVSVSNSSSEGGGSSTAEGEGGECSSGKETVGTGMDLEVRWYVNEWEGYVWDGEVDE